MTFSQNELNVIHKVFKEQKRFYEILASKTKEEEDLNDVKTIEEVINKIESEK